MEKAYVTRFFQKKVSSNQVQLWLVLIPTLAPMGLSVLFPQVWVLLMWQ